MKKKIKLIWQIYPSYLLIIIVSLAAISWYASTSFSNFFLNRTRENLEISASVFRQQIIDQLSSSSLSETNRFSNNQIKIDNIAKKYGRISSTRITVVLPDGRVIGESEENYGNMENHSNRPEIVRAFEGKTGSAIRYSDTLKQKMMYVTVPVEIDNHLLAVIRTAKPITDIDVSLKIIRIKTGIGCLLTALLASILCLFVSRRITRPIEDMKKGADHFGRGELEYRLYEPGTTELSALAESMNNMASQLSDRIKRVISQQNETQAVLSSMIEGVIAIDEEEKILFMNMAAASIFECPISEFTGRSIQEVIRIPALQKFVRESLASGKTVVGDIDVHLDGSIIINTKSMPLCDSVDTRIGTLMIFGDVTKLHQLENLRRDFAANVSHEIKTPLTAIMGFVETLLSGAMNNPDESGRFLRIIEKHADRLSAIIDDLMLLSSIEQEDEIKQIQLEEHPIKNCIEAAIQICDVKAKEKRIKINLSCNKNHIARIDPLLIEQAIVNLMDNAIKYSNEQDHINVECVTKDAEIVISVQDNGIGIAQKHLPRLFERFYRVDKARSRKLGGTGLGLAIVKHIIQVHGGHVTVDSTPGKGSIFAIHLTGNQI